MNAIPHGHANSVHQSTAKLSAGNRLFFRVLCTLYVIVLGLVLVVVRNISWNVAPLNEVYWPTLSNSSESSLEPFMRETYRKPCVITILTRRDLGYNGDGIHTCPHLGCKLKIIFDISDRYFTTSHVVIMFHRTFTDWTNLQRLKPAGQKWVFSSMESPRHTKAYAFPRGPTMIMNNPYDYIMTYRQQSHFPLVYGRFDRSQPLVREEDATNWAENKTHLAAWVASNCDSSSWARYAFVDTLRRFVSVDTYGNCGTMPLPSIDILHRYKFYLALENSECREYITEKFWSNALLHSAIPVVYGPPREDYEKVMPRDAFIHITDFASIEDLANYLVRVDKDDDLFNSYFHWKKVGRVEVVGEYVTTLPVFLCEIARRVLRDQEKEEKGIQVPPWMPEDWDEWWGGSCIETNSFPIRISTSNRILYS